MDSQFSLDVYLLNMLDKRLGQSKINSPRIKKYASRLGVPEKTIDFYLTGFRRKVKHHIRGNVNKIYRGPDYFNGTSIDRRYQDALSVFYGNHPLSWSRLTPDYEW